MTGASPADRQSRGAAVYSRIFGLPEDKVAAEFESRVGADFATEAIQAAGGTAWAHPALSGRDRSIAVIAALVTQGVAGDRLGTHLDLAREHGLDDDALTALMVLLAGYAGYPRASLAMETVHSRATPGRPSGQQPPEGPGFTG